MEIRKNTDNRKKKNKSSRFFDFFFKILYWLYITRALGGQIYDRSFFCRKENPMAALGIPAIIALIEGAVVIGGRLLIGSTVALGSALILKFIKDNAGIYAEAKLSGDGGEPTPVLPRGDTFVKRQIFNETVYERQSDRQLFVEDLSHYKANPRGLPHYEVYKNDKDLEKGKRQRSVTWDGKRMETFF